MLRWFSKFKAIDMQIEDLSDLKKAAKRSEREFLRFGLGLLFVVSIMI
jgi:hypothetical protein